MPKAGEKFARWINVENRGREPMVFDIVASDMERLDLVQRLGILDISAFSASGSVCRKAGSRQMELRANVKADTVQACVVSLEPVAQKIEENFVVCYTFDKEEAIAEDADYVVSMEENDLPELILDGQIDVVQALIEQIALAMDPYPRAEAAEDPEYAEVLQAAEDTVEASELEVHKPFANLKDLMNKK